MEKEILTVERCREDLDLLLRIDYLKMLLPLIASILLELGVLMLVNLSGQPEGYMFAVIFLLPFFVLLAQDVHTILRVRRMRRCAFEIVEDQLYSIRVDREISRGYKHSQAVTVYCLEFHGVGKYRISARPHYEWSKLCAMSYDEVYESSTPGDRFYIVLLKDGRHATPMMIYNTNLFEFDPDGTERKPRGSWRDSVSLE